MERVIRSGHIDTWGISSVGRASGWQPEGQRFEPAILHFPTRGVTGWGGCYPHSGSKLPLYFFYRPISLMRLLRGMPTLGKLAARSYFPARLLNR